MKTIELTKEEVDKLVNGENVLKIQDDGLHIVLKDKVEQWEPKGGVWSIDCSKVEHYVIQSKMDIKHGLVRETKEQAERAAKKMRSFNRLLAYVDEFENRPENERFYTVRYKALVGKWEVYCIEDEDSPFTNRMSEAVAHELCRKLNSGEVCL